MSDILRGIGQLFIIGFPGRKPSSSFLNFIHEENIGGVILFRANCPTHQMIQKNIQLIKDQMASTAPFIAVDQEGGRVCRVAGAPAEFASPSAYATRYGLDRFEEDYGRAALCMEALGINLVLGPVADIYLNAKNECLRDRCFGTAPEQVVPFVKKAVTVSKRYGLLSCLKHFPGLGAAETDPHVETPTAPFDELIWQQRESLPFAAGIEQGADLVMTTHLCTPAIDDRIATGSDKIISGLLRQRLAFDGPVITDDLTMKGAECLGHVGERAVAAFKAGHDLLLFGQEVDTAMEAFEYFKDAVLRGEISEELLNASLERVAGIKFKLGKSVIF
ncbi:MAG: hypothetical protein JSW34_06930 [Candidatus Zixiibacteriota bacterium]|nr:MAG: hypothetical protein JSW34_06930 [candidate division Zixibacteria bacterium]